MNITDELRAWAKEHLYKSGIRSDLLAIADRIDAEHQRTFRNLTDALHKQEDATRELDEKSVLLPVDADGVPICIGDVMEWVRYEDDDKTIVRKVSAVGAGVFFAWSDEQGRYAQYEAHAYRHHHAPTVEDVLREFALTVCKDDALTIRKDVVDEYAAKLMLRRTDG